MKTLFVDKIEDNDLGGFTKNTNKISYNLANYRLSIEEIINKSSPDTDYPVAVFRAGQYVAIFNCSRDLSYVQLAFINYEISIEDNFNTFADAFTPKTIPAFHEMQKLIRKAFDDLKLSKVALSDSEMLFKEVLKAN
ncbi:hypothetical protein [Flavobacterium psychrotrophum]|uniref:hypothetical protein n=1 Tax=Flavobacterium psychrotrophum TaxID=2294119 RepID=UPI000E31A28C|nr:hypothetical protein [Flavobacterium psychrotrophum]